MNSIEARVIYRGKQATSGSATARLQAKRSADFCETCLSVTLFPELLLTNYLEFYEQWSLLHGNSCSAKAGSRPFKAEAVLKSSELLLNQLRQLVGYLLPFSRDPCQMCLKGLWNITRAKAMCVLCSIVNLTILIGWALSCLGNSKDIKHRDIYGRAITFLRGWGRRGSKGSTDVV